MPERKRGRRRSDPNGFLVLTQFPFGGFHVVWCKTDSGAEVSRRNAAWCASEVHVIPVSDLLHWRKSGLDELEALYRSELKAR